MPIAQPPFDMFAADVIIRSSDNVDFHLFKAVLILASPFFSDMFSLTQPPASAVGAADPIPVTESSETLDCLMRFCYPIDDPAINDLSLLEKVLEAAIKYQMAMAVKQSKKLLQGFIESHALDVYAISCRLCIEDEARLAAQKWKSYSQFSSTGSFDRTLAGASYGAKMSTVTAGAYYRLLYYLRDASGFDSPIVFTDRGAPIQPRLVSESFDIIDPNAPSVTPPPLEALSSLSPCLHNTTGSDTVLLSRDGDEFPVLSSVLRLATADKLLDSESDTTASPSLHNSTTTLPIIPIDLPSAILAELLRLCYPLETFDTSTLSLLCAVYAAAKRWSITKITSAIQNQFQSFIANRETTVSLYFIATEQGWRQEAREAAKAIARNGLQYQYAPEMEDVSSVPYHNLLRFCHEYSNAVQIALQRHAPYYTPKPKPEDNLPIKLVALPIAASMMNVQNRYYSSYGSGDGQTLLTPNKQLDDQLTETLSGLRLQFADE